MRPGSIEGLTMTFNSGALALDAGAATYSTTAAIAHCIRGQHYSKGTVTNGTFPTTDILTGAAFVALAADKATSLLWGLDEDQAVVVAQGNIIDVDPDTDLLDGQGHLIPKLDSKLYCPFALTLHQRDGTGSLWTPGTSDWDATGLTDAIYNLATMLDRPPTKAVS